MIKVEEYFMEVVDEGRSTIGYRIIPYKVNDLVHEIYQQNKEIKKLKEKNKSLKEWKEANKATGICETCTDKTLRKNDLLLYENIQLKDKIQNALMILNKDVTSLDEIDRIINLEEKVRVLSEENNILEDRIKRQEQQINSLIKE